MIFDRTSTSFPCWTKRVRQC